MQITKNLIFSIAGNKCNLTNVMKKISYIEEKNFSKVNKYLNFLWNFSQTGVGVKELFTSLAQKVYDKQRNDGW